MPLSILSASSSASSSPPSYASVLKSIPGSSLRLSFITRSSITFCSLSSYLLLSSSTSSFLPKLYLTVYNLYIRYAFFLSLTKSTASAKVLLLRVLPPMIFKDLFNKFIPKTSATFSDPPSSAKTTTPQPP